MTSKHKIMVVDDNPINREVVVEALDGQYEIALAEDGSVVLSLAPSFQPDVVLLDVMMPGRDGFDVCRCFKQDYTLRQTRIIMVSARAELWSRLKGYEAGADDYVTKPFREEELLTKIEFALRTKRLQGLCGATGEVLALVSELRDTDCDPSWESIQTISHLLAIELSRGRYSNQIDGRFLDDLSHASILRDVGMLAIPEIVRKKHANPSSAELEQLKEHTLVGASLLNRIGGEHPNVTLFPMAAQVARSHHERFDGRGYPDGLASDDIPLAARIVLVAESLQHAVESLGHLDASGAEIARERIRSGIGSLYEPAMAEAVDRLFSNSLLDPNSHSLAQEVSTVTN